MKLRMHRLRSLLRRGAEELATAPRWQRHALVGIVGAIAITLLLGVILGGLSLARPGVLPGTTLDGRPVGGLDKETLAAAVASYAEERAGETIVVEAVTPAGPSKRLEYPRKDLGFAVEEDATFERVWRRGRRLNPILALSDHLRAFGGGIEVMPSTSVDDDRYESWAASAARGLDTEPVEAELRINGTDVVFTDARPGISVDREALANRVRAALDAGGSQGVGPQGVGPQKVQVPAAWRAPGGDSEALEALVGEAERAVSGPVRLTRGQAALRLSAEQIGDLLSVVRDGDEPRLAIDADALDALVDGETREALEREPVDARVRLSGGTIVIDESRDGFRFDPGAAATQVVEVATSERSNGVTPREAELHGEILEPGFTTADAEALEIRERVSSFTTGFTAGQSRVQNIHRMADLVDGAVLEPGETFSINEHVGPRTRESGFTEGGVIVGGEFETDVGGGVSQFATTFFNAAYFGGYEILEHRPHSYYISRYPEGRESTLYYPTIDVVIRNDSPYGLLIATSHTRTSVTVEMWGRDWVDVESHTSERRNITEPKVVVRENHHLPPGEERVVQSGRIGFTVSYTRILNYHDGGRDEQTWTHTYLPELRIIERNTAEDEEDAQGGETAEDAEDG